MIDALPFVVVTETQRTPEWHQARCGMLTGTDAKHLFAQLKSGGEPAGRRDLRTSIVVERLTGTPQDEGFVSKDMQRGSDLEGDAICAYELAADVVVQPVGFIRHHTLQAGCSLDGHVDNFTGIVEVKCPKSATHLAYWRAGKVPSDYLPQITHNLWVSGASWCDFVSFDPRFPEPLRLFVRRIEREAVDLKAYELLVRMFLAEVDKEHEDVARLMVAA